MQLLAQSRGARLEGSLMHNASRRVLYILETVEVPLRSAVQEAVAIIDLGGAKYERYNCFPSVAFFPSFETI